jgi:D-alanine--poly(phosphoribitol) ligase subunit 2
VTKRPQPDEPEPIAAVRLAALFAERLNVEVPSADTDLFVTGILDSLQFVELLAALEETFGVQVSVDEIELDDFRTLSRIARFVVGKAAQRSGVTAEVSRTAPGR